MRKIKFRFWERGKMDYDPCDGYGSPTPINDLLDREGVMQFTGLLDKNGKEIYEGDIVRNTWSDIYKSNDIVEVVKWNNGYHFQHSGAHTINQQIKVIGNIHEHPELIK